MENSSCQINILRQLMLTTQTYITNSCFPSIIIPLTWICYFKNCLYETQHRWVTGNPKPSTLFNLCINISCHLKCWISTKKNNRDFLQIEIKGKLSVRIDFETCWMEKPKKILDGSFCCERFLKLASHVKLVPRTLKMLFGFSCQL